MDFGAISRDLNADFERKIVRPRKFLEIFGRNRAEFRRATACRRSAPCLGTSAARGKAARRRAARISARSRIICARTLEEKRGLVATLDLKPQNPTQMLKSGHYHKTRGQQSGCSALDATVI